MKVNPMDLRDFIKILSKNRRLRIVNEPVDVGNIPFIISTFEREKKAILFKNILNREGSLISNLLGGKEFLSLAFNCEKEDILKEYTERVKNPISPNIVSYAPCQEIIVTGSKIDVRKLPVLIHSEKDAGPYITAGIVIAKDPETGIRNVSINRIQVIGSQELLINIPQHLGIIQKKAESMGKSLELAVAIGNHPFELIAAASKPPFGVDEFYIAGGLRQKPLDLVPCKTVSIEVPAWSEVVLEGEIPPNEKKEEGPFGDFMGYYVPVTMSHVFRLRAITYRKNFIFQAIKAGSIEDNQLLSLPREAQIYSSLLEKGIHVCSVSLHTMIFNCFISIRKRNDDDVKITIITAFESYPWLKYCVVVDHDVNVSDANDVWWAIGTRSSPEKGTFIIKDSPGFYRDPFRIHQSKLGIDATIPLGHYKEFERTKVFNNQNRTSSF